MAGTCSTRNRTLFPFWIASKPARSEEFRQSLQGMTNLYGDGCASQRIVSVLDVRAVGRGTIDKTRAGHRMRIPLSAPDITEADIEAVVSVLRTPRLSIGPKMEEFERSIADLAGVPHGIAVSSGTAGLHLCLRALGDWRG